MKRTMSLVVLALTAVAVGWATEDPAVSEVRIDTAPLPAGIYVEGFVAGMTPCTVRVRKGDRIHVAGNYGFQHGLTYTFQHAKKDYISASDERADSLPTLRFVYPYGGETELRFEYEDAAWYREDAGKKTLVAVNLSGKFVKHFDLARLAEARPGYLWVRVDDAKVAAAVAALKDIPSVGMQIVGASDAGVAALAGVKNLEILYLVGGTRAVSSADAGMGPKTTVQSLAPLAGLTSLKKLNLDGCDLVRDFSPVAGLVNLSSLGLEQCAGATNLSFLAGLKQLRSMGLPPGTTDDQLAAICKEHPDLLHLNAELCGRLTDLAPLAGLPLESLNLELSGGIKDIGPAATLKNLRAFGAPSRGGNEALAAVCKGAPGIRFLSLAWAAGNDIAPLAELKSLEWLYLGRFCAPKKLDLKVLSGIKSLTCINFDCGDPGEIGFVAPMTWLRHLCLRECRSLKEISPLAGLANLEVLSLRYCWSVKDIAPLSGLSKLRWFDHCLCPAEDLAPLSNLPELVYMDLGTCVATNAAPLRDAKNLKKLKYLTFGYSKMSKAERRAVQEALPDCRVN